MTALVLLMVEVLNAAELEQRSFRCDTGEVALRVPRDWPAVKMTHNPRGTITLYQFGPADTNFLCALRINDAAVAKTNVVNGDSLEHCLGSICTDMVTNSVEGKVQSQRFGLKKDGVYARFTSLPEERRPRKKAERFKYLTRGIRLVGTNVVAFSLLSNDADQSALWVTLSAVESIKMKGGPTNGSSQ